MPRFVSCPRGELQEIRNLKIHRILTLYKTRKCQIMVSLCRTELVEISTGKVRIGEAVAFLVVIGALLFPTATRSRCFSLQQHEAATWVQRKEADGISGVCRASGGISQVLKQKVVQGREISLPDSSTASSPASCAFKVTLNNRTSLCFWFISLKTAENGGEERFVPSCCLLPRQYLLR